MTKNGLWSALLEKYSFLLLLMVSLGIFLGGITGRAVGVPFEGDLKPYSERWGRDGRGRDLDAERGFLGNMLYVVSVILPFILICALAMALFQFLTDYYGLTADINALGIGGLLFLWAIVWSLALPFELILEVSWICMEALSGKNLVDSTYLYANEPMLVGELTGEIMGVIIALISFWFIKKQEKKVSDG
ncbi:MAG: hypothetical protein ACFFB3_08520 [Candidatus Hodarchaeota archaeon]